MPHLIPRPHFLFLSAALVLPLLAGCGGEVEPSVRVMTVTPPTPAPPPPEPDWDAVPLCEDAERFDPPGVLGIAAAYSSEDLGAGGASGRVIEIPVESVPAIPGDAAAEARLELTFGLAPGPSAEAPPVRVEVAWTPPDEGDAESADMLLGMHAPAELNETSEPRPAWTAALRTIRVPLPTSLRAGGTLRFTAHDDAGTTVAARIVAPRIERPAKEPRPSILFAISDAHRWDYSVGGEGPALMPRLRGFADGALVPEHSWSPATWTLPAITSLVTGLHPRFHTTGRFVGRAERSDRGAAGEAEPQDDTASDAQRADVPAGAFAIGRGDDRRYFQAFPDGLRTLPAVLRRCGYRTVLIHANPYWTVSGLAADGFDLALWCADARGENVNRFARDVLASTPPDQPLFLVVHYMDVHEYLRREFAVEWPGEDPWHADAEKVRAAYRKAAAGADALFGGLADAWDAARGTEESMAVFLSDHGEHLFDPGRERLAPENHGGRWNSGVLDHGNTAEDVLLRVPLVVRLPGGARRGEGAGMHASLIDLFPTVLDLLALDAETVPALQGRSLLRPAGGEGKPRVFHSDYQLYGADLSTVRRGTLKLVLDRTRQKRRLVDRTLPYPPGGESGQTRDDAEAAAELGAIMDRYDAEAWLAARDLRSELRKGNDAAEALGALGYLR